jgi:hypothetical protein
MPEAGRDAAVGAQRRGIDGAEHSSTIAHVMAGGHVHTQHDDYHRSRKSMSGGPETNADLGHGHVQITQHWAGRAGPQIHGLQAMAPIRADGCRSGPIP